MLKKIDIGDSLYWSSRDEEVSLVEKPSEINAIARCKCQRYNKEIVDIPARLLRRLSKGNFSGVYLITRTGKNKNKARELEQWSKYYGFRAEIEKKDDDDYILRIYGDSQQEVDEFIELYFRQKRVLVF